VVLTGYETVTVFSSDFNTTSAHWYDQFIPARASKPGARCDPVIYNVGDTFSTNTSFFQWKVQSVAKANASTVVSYKGYALDGCDVSSTYINADLRSWTMDGTTVIKCRMGDDIEMDALTSFSISALPGKFDSLVGGFLGDKVSPRIATIQAMSVLSPPLIVSRLTFIEPTQLKIWQAVCSPRM
jgi:hypothetical protein